MKLALIGKSLSHSFSKSYFMAKFERENLNASYDNLEFNVTVRYEIVGIDVLPQQLSFALQPTR